MGHIQTAAYIARGAWIAYQKVLQLQTSLLTEALPDGHSQLAQALVQGAASLQALLDVLSRVGSTVLLTCQVGAAGLLR